MSNTSTDSTVQTCRKLVRGYFGSGSRTRLWFDAPNPLLGGLTPNDLIQTGQEKKLLRIIKDALNGV